MARFTRGRRAAKQASERASRQASGRRGRRVALMRVTRITASRGHALSLRASPRFSRKRRARGAETGRHGRTTLLPCLSVFGKRGNPRSREKFQPHCRCSCGFANGLARKCSFVLRQLHLSASFYISPWESHSATTAFFILSHEVIAFRDGKMDNDIGIVTDKRFLRGILCRISALFLIVTTIFKAWFSYE